MKITIYNGDDLARNLKAFGIPCAFLKHAITPAAVVYSFKPTEPQTYDEKRAEKAVKRLAVLICAAVEFSPVLGGFNAVIQRPDHLRTYPNFNAFGERLKSYGGAAAFALGIDDENKPRAMLLRDCPHVLIAGASGSGKTIFLHSFIASITCYSSNAQFVLIDAKQTEFAKWANLDKLNRLAAPIITDAKTAAGYLRAAVDEMNRRFARLKALGLRDNSRGTFGELVIIVDELADLMLQNRAEIEKPLVLIAQKGRAAGVHLVLATQRPTVNIVTGLIKANIPMRVCFSVASVRDSVVMLDRKGAEKLRGRGDALVQFPDGSRVHLQAPYFNPDKIADILPATNAQTYKTKNKPLKAPKKPLFAPLVNLFKPAPKKPKNGKRGLDDLEFYDTMDD